MTTMRYSAFKSKKWSGAEMKRWGLFGDKYAPFASKKGATELVHTVNVLARRHASKKLSLKGSVVRWHQDYVGKTPITVVCVETHPLHPHTVSTCEILDRYGR